MTDSKVGVAAQDQEALATSEICGTNCQDHSIMLQDSTKFSVLSVLKHPDEWVEWVSFSPDDNLLSTCSAEIAFLWRMSDLSQLGELSHPDSVWKCAFSCDGFSVLCACRDGKLYIWSTQSTDAPCKVIHAHSLPVYGISCHPTLNLVATASKDCTIKLFDFDKSCDMQTPKDQISPPKTMPRDVDKSTETIDLSQQDVNQHHVEHYKLTSSNEQIQSGNDTETEKEQIQPKEKHNIMQDCSQPSKCNSEALLTLTGHSDVVEHVCFSPSGSSLVSCSKDKIVRLYELDASCSTMLSVKEGHGHEHWVYCCVFSQDGRLIASSSADKTIRLWDPSNMKTLVVLEGHSNVVWCCKFLSRCLVSCSSDRTVR